MSAPLLQARGVTKAFRLKGGLFAKSTSHVAVNAIDIELQPRERLGVVGESGSGKSTLGRLLLGLTNPTLGEVEFEGKSHAERSSRDWSEFRRRTALVQQNPLSALNPQMTVGQQIAEALLVHHVADRNSARERAASMLEKVGLARSMVDRFPHQMSGGQRQRVVIARALILDPRLVVFDEAVSALDVSVQAQVVALLRQLWQESDLAYVFITHDLRIVRHLVDRIAVMYLGRIVETGSIGEVYSWPKHPYTRALLASVPVMDTSVRNVPPPIQGELDYSKMATGCAFRSRCPFVVAKCESDTPVLRNVGDQKVACHRAEEFPRQVSPVLEVAS